MHLLLLTWNFDRCRFSLAEGLAWVFARGWLSLGVTCPLQVVSQWETRDWLQQDFQAVVGSPRTCFGLQPRSPSGAILRPSTVPVDAKEAVEVSAFLPSPDMWTPWVDLCWSLPCCATSSGYWPVLQHGNRVLRVLSLQAEGYCLELSSLVTAWCGSQKSVPSHFDISLCMWYSSNSHAASQGAWEWSV